MTLQEELYKAQLLVKSLYYEISNPKTTYERRLELDYLFPTAVNEKIRLEELLKAPYYNPATDFIEPPISPMIDKIVIGEIYKNGSLISSGKIKQSDLDNLLAQSTATVKYTFKQTNTPAPAPSEGADPFKGGFDPETGSGLPFIRDARGNKIFIYPLGETLIISDKLSVIKSGSKVVVLE